MSVLLAVLISITIAYLFGELAKLCKLPRVVGHLVTGVILGISPLKAAVFDEASLDAIGSLANIGFILLLFFTGLEVNIFKFRSNVKRGFAISILNTAIPLLLGFFVSRLFGIDTIPSLIIGVTLSVGAVAVSVDVLEELKILKTRFASALISASAVDDMVELLVIATVLAIAKLSTLTRGLYSLIFEVSLFIVLILLLKSIVIPFILKVVEKEGSATSLFTGSMIIAILMASLSEILGFGSFVGALIAGVIVRKVLLSGKDRRPWEEHEIAKTMHTITFGFFAPLFFIFIGLKTDFYHNFNVVFSLIITGVALLGAVVGAILGGMIVRLSPNNARLNFKESALLGWGLAAKGDTELIIAAVALQHNLIDVTLFTAIVFMGIVTTIIAVIMFRINIKRECKYFNIC